MDVCGMQAQACEAEIAHTEGRASARAEPREGCGCGYRRAEERF